MRFLILFVISILTSSCGVIQCVDSQFERKPIPIKGESVFEVTFSDGDIKSHVIKCEKYYSAICASRGNSWKVREVGKAGSLKRSYFSVLTDSYEIELPTCRQLTDSNSKITMDDISIVWNKEGVETMQTDSGTITSWLGKRFHYVSSTNGIHKFKTGGYGDEPLEIVEFEFDLKLNGIRLD
jgi:hypothetical protein